MRFLVLDFGVYALPGTVPVRAYVPLSSRAPQRKPPCRTRPRSVNSAAKSNLSSRSRSTNCTGKAIDCAVSVPSTAPGVLRVGPMLTGRPVVDEPSWSKTEGAALTVVYEDGQNLNGWWFTTTSNPGSPYSRLGPAPRASSTGCMCRY
eukprot:988050-Rhodomonas_salina.3